MDKKTQAHIWYAVLAGIAILLVQAVFQQSREPVVDIPYSSFVAHLENDEIATVDIRGDRIRGRLKDGAAAEHPLFAVNRVDPALADLLSKHGVEYSSIPEDTMLGNLLSWLMPIVVFFAIWFFLFRRVLGNQGLGGALSVGKSKAKIYVERDIRVSFDDVAGVDEAKDELKEIIDFLRDPAGYGRLGAHMPKGILLIGPPGTGKTLLARAVAGEAGVAFFSINGSEFVEMFVGVGAARVRDLFEQARKQAPCIIFIDELDALGRARGAFPGLGGHDEKEQTLNQLLAELDGFDASGGVVLLAATNRPEVLDAALLRAGRFDRQILVDRPDKLGREAILEVHLRKVTLADDVSPPALAALTPGFTGADLANLVNEAALIATRRGGTAVTMEDFTAAIERLIAGLEKRNRLLNEDERRVVAYHEMGHALVALTLPGVDRVHKVSIIPRGIGALGYTIQRPTEDRYLMGEQELRARMAVLLGGRAAEGIVFDHVSTGAADDLVKATDIARAMVVRYGMNGTLGNAAYESEAAPFLTPVPGMVGPSRHYSEATAREIDVAVRELVEGALATARAVLRRNRAVLDETAARLLARETLSADDLEPFRARLEQPAPATAA
ncbi:ATP-dependent zinc metalloprotease FtsH [Oceanibacterium hippocampi]|uniref:ATP-dependent zinc metalloprotease FtsH n=1 Tax=Oceanibacterium hippocampi TaxID=745714 RepID=A0A1Y5T6A4_9PROT|nr:ATP-dependent zinc metalloprotease FtsH [Oceanibacterium hippocampi]SLN54890.1 ATP-dependent zinc metalloprotease FtsH 4 [Oceanibacterium hippocampi]